MIRIMNHEINFACPDHGTASIVFRGACLSVTDDGATITAPTCGICGWEMDLITDDATTEASRHLAQASRG